MRVKLKTFLITQWNNFVFDHPFSFQLILKELLRALKININLWSHSLKIKANHVKNYEGKQAQAFIYVVKLTFKFACVHSR